jgi:hypothetical protein
MVNMKTNLLTAIYLLVAAALFPLQRFCEKQTAGFSMARISFSLPAQSMAYTPPDGEILKQKFRFLGSGGQCFAFVSEDGEYVIKLLSRGVVPTFLLDLPMPVFFKEAVMKRASRVQKKWQRDLQSYQLAFTELKDESGLVNLHVQETNCIGKRLNISDPLGIAHAIDLDKTAFILQKKAEPLLCYLYEQVKAGRIDDAKHALEQTISLLSARCQKGIFDEDPRLHKNLGFVNGAPIFIDVGRFKKDEMRKSPKVYQQDLLSMTPRLRAWLAQEDPRLAQHLDTLVKNDH